MFRYNGSNWVQAQKLLAEDGAAGDGFGNATSIKTGETWIGAAYEDDGGTDAGAVYIFRYDSSSWMQAQKLLAVDGAAGDRFGGSVSLGVDRAVVGALMDDDNGAESGAAYIYRYDGSRWISETKLLASDGAAGDRFGQAVFIDGDMVLVGADREDENGLNAGAAYTYDFFNEALLCEGDFESDGDVDGSDLAVFAADFGRTDCAGGLTCEGDFDGDSDVDGSDLAVFAVDFGRVDCALSTYTK
jgi:hypothetical protein